MEIQKAIEWIGAISATQSNSLNKNIPADRKKEALHMEVAALEKQTPKKIIITSKNGSYVYYKCPNCDHEIGSAFHYSPNEYMMEHKFCEKCGQSIDWSETI